MSEIVWSFAAPPRETRQARCPCGYCWETLSRDGEEVRCPSCEAVGTLRQEDAPRG